LALYKYVGVYKHFNDNKAIVDIKLRPGTSTWRTQRNIQTRRYVVIGAIFWKRDVIHKTGST